MALLRAAVLNAHGLSEEAALLQLLAAFLLGPLSLVKCQTTPSTPRSTCFHTGLVPTENPRGFKDSDYSLKGFGCSWEHREPPPPPPQMWDEAVDARVSQGQRLGAEVIRESCQGGQGPGKLWGLAGRKARVFQGVSDKQKQSKGAHNVREG